MELRQKGHKVVDVFPFLNEFELLELRLTTLSPYVDYFVLVESPMTFSGNEKPLFFNENKDMFDKWKDKLIPHVVRDPLKNKKDLKSRLSSKESTPVDKWILEQVATSHLTHSHFTHNDFPFKQAFFQKESARKAIPLLDDNDLVFYGDLDEIWNPEMTFDWNENMIFKLEQTVFQCWMNNRSSEKWSSAYFTASKNIQNHSLNVMRSLKMGEDIVIVEQGGWHFTYQGGADRIRYKIESYDHQELNKRRVKSQIGNHLSLKQDLFNRNFQFTKDESILPAEVLAMKSRLPGWFL